MSIFPPYILLDAARMGDAMVAARELNPNHESLYRAPKGVDEVLPVVAPFLFTWPHTKAFSDFILKEGWGNSWGTWVGSVSGQKELLRHLRRFLMVQTEDGQQLYFRFYDPRVLRIFLPTCLPDQLKEFFGPIDYFLLEDENAALALRCRQQKGQLQTEKISFVDVIHGITRPLPDAGKEQVPTAPAGPKEVPPAGDPDTAKAPDKPGRKWITLD